jgi:two-component system cell cycle sensor histidine kinase PleC
MARGSSNVIGLKGQESRLFNERFEKMSHDFRTPLNIIIGFTELLLDEAPGKINNEQRRSLNDILDSGQRLLSLVNDIFNQSSPD